MRYKEEDFDTIFIDVSFGSVEYVDEDTRRRVCPVRKTYELTGINLAACIPEAERAFLDTLNIAKGEVLHLLQSGIKMREIEL